MTDEDFRRLALRLPEATEGAHMGHPDFRVGGKVFASLGPEGDWGMVRLKPEQQAPLLAAAPAVFEPASGAWGRGGATIVRLRAARKAAVEQALLTAWRNTAPRRLVQRLDLD